MLIFRLVFASGEKCFLAWGKNSTPPQKKIKWFVPKNLFFSTVEHTYMHGFSELLVIVYIWQ
jgi:hypothetical protein